MANHVSHAALPYPVKGCRYTIPLTYYVDGVPTDPTTPDTERSIDGAAFSDCTEEATTVSGSNGMAYITLTGDETNGSLILVAPKASPDPMVRLSLQPRVLPVVLSGTAQAGAAGTITLPSGASSVDNDYNGMIVRTTGGTGGGGGSGSQGNQARVITDYVGSTKVATIAPNWETTPDNTTTLEVLRTEFAESIQSAVTDKTGYSLSASGIQAIWDALTSALSTASSIGKLLVDNINATLSSRASQTSMDAVKTKTDQLTFTVSNKVDSTATLSSGQIVFKKNTTLSNFKFVMKDSSDHITLKTGLTVSATRSIDNGSFAACANSVSELSNGWYLINLAAADMNGDSIALRFTASGADTRNITLFTQP